MPDRSTPKALLTMLLCILCLAGGCADGPDAPAPAAERPPADEPANEEAVDPEISAELLAVISYRMGYSFGLTWAQHELEPDAEQLMQGMADAVAGRERRIPKREMDAARATFMRKLSARRDTWGPRNLAAGEAFLAENARREGVVVLPSGLQYEVLSTGDGPKPNLEDKVVVHNRTYRIDGREIESTHWLDEPPEYLLSSTIEGWKEALQMMSVGSRWKLYIPPHLAYGEPGYRGFIQPNDTLIYDIELLGIEEPDAS